MSNRTPLLSLYINGINQIRVTCAPNLGVTLLHVLPFGVHQDFTQKKLFAALPTRIFDYFM